MISAMSAFSQLSPELRARIADHFKNQESLKFKQLSLTPIQEKAIPEILDGKNCILSAQTASGKTEAAFWPLLDRIKEEKEQRAALSVSCIYLSPLTALLNNIEPRLSDYAGFISGETFKWHGGTSRSLRKKAISKPPDILLTTPESLEVILDSASYAHRLFFEGLEFIVIDEVHYFVDSERGAQLVALLERLSNISGRDLQRIGLSATVGNPRQVLKWFCGSSKREQSVLSVESLDDKEKQILLEYYPLTDDAQKNINNRIFRHITGGGLKKSILFTNSRQNAELLGGSIEHMLKEEKLEDRLHVHHGSVSQNLREEAERLIDLKSQDGKRCIVSTSTLELGIDIGGLETVIQAGEFSSVSSYLQRIGRTGRSNEDPQNLLSLTSSPFDFLKNLAILELGEKAYVESYWPAKRNYSLLFQQLLGSILSHSGIAFDTFWQTVCHSYPFSGITRQEATSIADHGLKQNYFTRADDLLLIGEEGEREFSKQHWIKIYSTFETSPAVRVVKDNQEIGTLDAWWVFNKKLPYVFLLGGKKLRAKELDEDHGVLYVESAPKAEPPAWASSGALTEKLVAQRMRRILISKSIPEFINHHQTSLDCLKYMREAINAELLNREGLGYEFMDSKLTQTFVHTFAGDRLNQTLALIIRYFTDLEIKELNALSFALASKEYSETELVENLEHTLLSFAEGHLFNLNTPEETFGDLDVETESLTKFSKYLPKELQLKQFLHMVYDFHGLRQWILQIKDESGTRLLSNTEASGLPKLIEESLGM